MIKSKKIIESNKVNEAVDVSKIIKDLGGDFGGDNESQMGGVQLLKGLATSDDPKSNEFMKKLDKATTQISKEMSEGVIKEAEDVCEECGKPLTDGICVECSSKTEAASTETFKCPDCGSKVLKQTGYCLSCKKKVGNKKKEQIIVSEEFTIPGTDIILEKGDKIVVNEEASFSFILSKVGRNNEGVAYIVYNTITKVEDGMDPQDAFITAAEDENFYGSRPDVVRFRKMASEALEGLFGIKVDALKGF
jgi:hypothetical protein